MLFLLAEETIALTCLMINFDLSTHLNLLERKFSCVQRMRGSCPRSSDSTGVFDCRLTPAMLHRAAQFTTHAQRTDETFLTSSWCSADSCYAFIQKPDTWNIQAAICDTNGGDLVSIHSARENNRVRDLVRLGNSSAFIGLERMDEEMDGSNSGYRNWATNGR